MLFYFKGVSSARRHSVALIFFNAKPKCTRAAIKPHSAGVFTGEYASGVYASCGYGRTARLALTQALNFTRASFVFILNYRHYTTLLEPTAQVRTNTKVFNPGIGFQPAYSSRFLWYAWSGFLSTLLALALQRCALVMLVSPRLRLMAQAMSWYTSAGAYARWRRLVRLLEQPGLLALAAKGDGVEPSTVVLLLRPVTSYTAFAALRKSKMPLLGYGGTALSEQLLWQNAGFYSIDLNFQYVSLMVFWSLFVKFCR